MPKRRIPVSPGRYCPLCGGTNLNNKGVSHYDKLPVFNCKDCDCYFRANIEYEKRPDWSFITITYHNQIRFNSSIIEQLNIVSGDKVSFFFDEKIFVDKSKEGFSLALKGKVGRTLQFTCSDLAWALRFEFENIIHKQLRLYLNEKNLLMGIIAKSTIKNKVHYEQIEVGQKPFLGIRPTGSIYISALMKSVLQCERGDVLMLYEYKAEYYIFLADKSKDPIKDGFRISTHGYAGFERAMQISSNKLAMFLCDVYKIPPGDPFRVTIDVKRVEIDGRSMFRLSGTVE